jgi:Domain of unknown function (DUF4136)
VGRAALAITLFSLLGCTELGDDPNQPGSSDEVFTEWDRSADFTAYTSFAFIEATDDEPELVSLNETRVRNAVRTEYEELGLVEAEDADVEVMILSQTDKASSLELDCIPSVYWYGGTGGYNSCALLELDRKDVTIGTIMLGIGDASRGETVFNGVMQGIANGQDLDIRIDHAVGRVFNTYPAEQTGM